MSKKVSVVIRQMYSLRPVVTEIRVIPDSVDDAEHFTATHLAEVKREFCNKFVEFEAAAWYSDIVYLNE